MYAVVACVIGLVLSSCVGAKPSDLNLVKLHSAPSGKPVPLVTNSKAVAAIVVPEGSGRTTSSAARDLQLYIKRSTGAELPIVKTLKDKSDTAVFIGACPEAKAVGLDPEKMPIEGFAIKTAPNRLYIVGHDDAGTAWGIYEFLERFVGVRWYWPDDLGESVPKTKSLTVAPVSLTDAPFFRKREIWPSGGPRVAPAQVGKLHQRLRSNDSWPVKLIVHAPHNWSKRYGKSRPQIFQLRKDGKRDYAMLCYGNPLTLKTYLEEIERQSKPDADIARGENILKDNNITVSPNDMSVSCNCEYCQKLWDANGGQYGSASKILAEFVRKLAEEVKTRWPDKTVIFLPYKNYTYAPKGIKFPGNVEVQICGMPGLAQYKDSAINASEQKNIDDWIKASGRRIQNWHYSCWPANQTKAAYLFPHTIQKHYQANRDKTVGTFINGVGNHWPRQHLSLYTWMKVLWNPDFNVDYATDEFCHRMFGPAAKTMRELVRMQTDGWEKNPWTNHKFSPKTVYGESFPKEDVKKMEKLLAQAFQDAKGNDLVTKRLEYYAVPLRAFFAESKLITEGKGIKPLNAYQAAENPTIDGNMNEACWKDIKPVYLIRATDKKNPKAKFPTSLKAVWTREGITFGFKMMEPTPDKLRKDIGKDTRDASLIWWNDNVEMFLDVTGERTGYYQFIVNASGSLFDSKGSDLSWNSTGVKTGVQVNKDNWTLEVYIPFKTFDNPLLPGTGVEWYGNFTRHRVTDRKNREYQRLNTTFSGPSNDQNAFGPIKFIER